MTRRFEPDDLLLEQRITDIHVIPDKRVALCVVRAVHPGRQRHDHQLWSFPLEGGEPRQLSFGPADATAPRFSPDGRRIAFLSDRETPGVAQIHLMPADGGEARPLSRLARGALDIRWRPDGRRLLATGKVTVDPDQRAAGCERLDGADAEAPDEDAPRLCWRLPYKLDGSGYLLDTRLHAFLVDAESGDSCQLTHGDYDVNHAEWSPDGRRLCYSRTRGTPGEEHCTDIWVMDIDGDAPGAARRLSFDQANAGSPAWSPDGRWIVFSGSSEAGDAQTRLWLIDVALGQVRGLGSESLEVMPDELQWRRDSREVVFIRVSRGLQHVAAIRVPEGSLRLIAEGERQVAKVAANDLLVYSAESGATPLELFCIPWEGGEERPLSDLNAWWRERSPPQLAYRRFDVPDGDGGSEGIDGWLVTPADAPRGARPLLVDVHGGPASHALLAFNIHPYWQVLASRGWSILALNTVGSSSYGRDFSARLRSRWGELDLPQLLAAIEQLQREGIADARVAIVGTSYGGYLGAYAAGHCDVFRAAIVGAPVANMESHYGTSDSGYYADAYSTQGEPRERRELLARLSPMSAIEKVRTPMLFLQGEDDQRCPRGQSEELFVKLRRRGRTPTEMVLYPGGSHHVFSTGKPAHRLDIQARIVDWLERWIDRPLQA